MDIEHTQLHVRNTRASHHVTHLLHDITLKTPQIIINLDNSYRSSTQNSKEFNSLLHVLYV